jgi:hypothetical protein
MCKTVLSIETNLYVAASESLSNRVVERPTHNLKVEGSNLVYGTG